MTKHLTMDNIKSWPVYIFFREEGWYPVQCRDDADVFVHVELNPGTVKVEDIAGRLVWRPQ